MRIRFPGYFLVLVALAGALRGQSTLPTLTQPFPAQSIVPGGAAVTLDLRSYLGLPGVTGQVVQFDTIRGKFNAELLAADAPLTVANFINYLNQGAYTNSVVHRSVPGFVIQAGGYVLAGSTIQTVSTAAPVQNEFKVPNTRGTLAMAKLGTGPNTATSQWFVNLADNRANLDNQNGGFTVFARVLGSGMTVADSIASIPVYNASAQLGAVFNEMPLTSNSVSAATIVLVRSVAVIPIYPTGSGAAVLQVTGENSAPTVVRADLTGTSLVMTPLAAGSATITLRAADTQGNVATGALVVTVPAPPVFSTQPSSQSVAAGGSALLSASAATPVTYQWQYNGRALANATTSAINLTNVQPALTGLYTVVATSGTSAGSSRPAIIGVTASQKVIGTGSEIAANILHPNQNTFDQILLEGAAAVASADAGQVTRISFIDLNDDIVQVEFAGAGNVSLVLAEPSGPAAPVKYSQPAVSYMKGHVGLVVTGANETTNLSVFTVGRATAYDPTGAYNILLPPSEANFPANNGSPLFVGQEATAYDGVADLAFVAIASTNGKFGGLRTANARYYAIDGLTGVYAPGVEFTGPIFVGDITALGSATPSLQIGGSSDAERRVWITGGDLAQDNARAVQVSGVSQLSFKEGSTSKGTLIAAQANRGILVQDGVDVTTQIVVNP